MERSWYTRVGVILLVTLGSIWFLVPTYYSFVHLSRADRNNVKKLEEVLPKWAPPAKYRLSLGLDLQGGIHMVMRVDTKTALMKRTERRAVQMVNLVSQKKLGTVTQVSDPEKLLVTLTVADPTTMDAIEKEVLASSEDFSKVGREGNTLTLKLNDAKVDMFMNDSVEQAMLVIRRRIDKYGVAEVDVRRLGTDSIQISLPGKDNPEEVRELVGTAAQLEFRLVEPSGSVFKDMVDKEAPDAASGITLVSTVKDGDGNEPPPPYLEGTDREKLLAYVKGKAPEGKQVLVHGVESERRKAFSKYYTFLVDKNVPLTGESLTGADARNNTTDNQVEVSFQFNAQGAKDLEELTGKNSGRRMAIVLDDNVVMAPNINEKISGGKGRITLGRRGQLQDRLREAQNLALNLKAGALPAPVTAGEIRQVGASLGDDLIYQGTMAALVGLALVALFMAVYYRLSGLIADVALLLNAALILAGLAVAGATLTLPGIAGFVLTLGIAVDANVLINERIREELAAGKSPQVAVDQGYDRAFWTIFDAHVTTLIAGLILQQTGTGPVQGFATTLIIGIVASLFTSIVVTRAITTYVVHGRKAVSVSV